MRTQIVPALVIALCACASTGGDPETVPLCGPLASLQPLSAPAACEESALARYASELSQEVVKPMSRALVRVEFDETARVRSVCVETPNPSDAWLARRHLAAQSDAIAKLPPGPPCLVGMRLDLNRYEATLAEIAYYQALCPAFAGNECMEDHGDWITRNRIGWARPFLFVAPEIENPPDLDASDTVSRCWRKAKHPFEPQAACIQAEGWEMLLPPLARR